MGAGAGCSLAPSSAAWRLSALREMSSRKDYSSTPLSRKLGAKPGLDVVVFFTTSREELERRFPALKATMNPADGLWVAWPKKASKIETDLDFDTVQRIGLDAGLVDNKSASIDDLWQAVRFVYRLEDR
jgi:hypothetical protein